MAKYVNESEEGKEERIMPDSAWDAERNIAMDRS